jgi:uncharacterized protein YdaU (DUF1376 family)
MPVGSFPALTVKDIDMHYYKFNIADYRKDTAHLTPIEHYIYRSLIDWYYLDELPIPKETESVIRRLSLDNHSLGLLQNVLHDFFKLSETGYIHKRIDVEIAEYHGMIKANTENGKKGGRPPKPIPKREKTQSVKSANRDESEINPNYKPLTINQEPLTIESLRGSRLSIPQIHDEWVNWAILERPELTATKIHSIYEQFYDYWKAQPGSKGIKLDWFATWRNWVRRDKSFGRVERLSVAEQNRAVVDAFNLKLDQQEEGAIYEHE